MASELSKLIDEELSRIEGGEVGPQDRQRLIEKVGRKASAKPAVTAATSTRKRTLIAATVFGAVLLGLFAFVVMGSKSTTTWGDGQSNPYITGSDYKDGEDESIFSGDGDWQGSTPDATPHPPEADNSPVHGMVIKQSPEIHHHVHNHTSESAMAPGPTPAPGPSADGPLLASASEGPAAAPLETSALPLGPTGAPAPELEVTLGPSEAPALSWAPVLAPQMVPAMAPSGAPELGFPPVAAPALSEEGSQVPDPEDTLDDTSEEDGP